MIQASELRQGNLIYYGNDQYKRIVTVTEIQKSDFIDSFDESDTYYDNDDSFYPIPLTQGWLVEKMGFTKNSFDKYRFDIPNDGGNRYHVIPYELGYVFRCAGCSLVEVDSVHELQNIYRSLVRKELSIK